MFCSFRRQYQPLSLNRLQYLIDLGRVDPTQPIDLTQLVNGRGVTIQPFKRDYGVQLVEEVNLGSILALHRRLPGFHLINTLPSFIFILLSCHNQYVFWKASIFYCGTPVPGSFSCVSIHSACSVTSFSLFRCHHTRKFLGILS